MSFQQSENHDRYCKIASMAHFMKRTFTIFARNSKDVKVKDMNLTYENSDKKSISDCETTRSSMSDSVTTENEEKKTKQKKSVKICKRVTVKVLDEFDVKSHDLWYTNTEIELFRKETISQTVFQRKSKKEAISRLLKSLESVSST